MRHHPLRQLCLLSCTTLAVSCVTPGSKIPYASNTVVRSAMPFQGPQASADQMADALFVSLKKNDFIEAEQHFDNAMKQGLPPDRLEAVWNDPFFARRHSDDSEARPEIFSSRGLNCRLRTE
jgi:hypothetical protein